MSASNKPSRALGKLLLLGGGGLVALFLVEGVLAVLGAPSETGYTYEPGFDKQFRCLEFSYHFKANNLGLRSPELPSSRPPGAHRVLVLGDSYTEGLGVEADESFCALLDRDFRPEAPLDFINGGIRGRGPLHYGRVLMTAGLKTEPTTVLIALHTNDVTDTEPSDRPDHIYSEPRRGLKKLCHALLPRLFILARTKLKDTEVPEQTFVELVRQRGRERGLAEEAVEAWLARVPPELIEAVDRDEYNEGALSHGLLKPRALTDALDIDRPEAEQRFGAMAGVLEEIVAECRRRGIAVGLVFTPAPMHYDAEWVDERLPLGLVNRREWLVEECELQRRLTALGLRLDVPYLDLTPAFRARSAGGEKLNFEMDGHWNPSGHRLAAEAISAWLEIHPALIES